jgi:hypothetical protein
LSKLAHRTQSVNSTRGDISWGGSNGNRFNSISLESLDDEDHLEVEFVGNLPAGLATAAPTPTTHTPVVHTPTPVTAAGDVNLGVVAGNQAGQHAQANVAAGSIVNPQVFSSGVCTSRNFDQVTLLACMNQEVARGIANLNSFLPRDDERPQTCLEAAITSANQCLSAAIVNGRPTANILQQIERFENQLDAILNTI